MIFNKIILIALFMAYPAAVYSAEIAISIDDAPMGDSAYMTAEIRTQRLLAGLHASNIEAIFFVTTQHINDESAKRLRQYTAAGHWLAHHSNSHRSANKISYEAYMADFALAQNVLVPFDNVIKFHRFPYLHYGNTPQEVSALQQAIRKAGYRDGYVTVDTAEWYLNKLIVAAAAAGHDVEKPEVRDFYVKTLWQTIQFYDELANKVLKRSPKHVLLLHENDAAALFLPALIDKIRHEGWQVISPLKAFQDPISQTVPATFFNKQGRIAALAHLEGLPEAQLRSPYEDLEVMKRQFEAIIHAE